MLLSRASIALLALVAVTACATHRTLIPRIDESPREGLSLERPLRVALLDARSEKLDSAEVVSSLREGLSQTYGDALLWVPYFEETPAGDVALRVRVLASGADFGSRLVVASAFATASSTGSAAASSPWGPVLAEARSQQNVLASGFSGEGWWIGTSWLELQIEDRRFGENDTVLFSIVAEDRQANLWGYRSANQAAQHAWAKVAQGLVRVLDALLMTVRDHETP